MKDVCKKLLVMVLLCTMLFNPVVSYAEGTEASRVGSLLGSGSADDGSTVDESSIGDDGNLAPSTSIEVEVEDNDGVNEGSGENIGSSGGVQGSITSAENLTGVIDGTSNGVDLDKFTKLLDDNIWLSSSEMEESPTGKRKLYKYGIKNVSDRDGVLGTKLELNYSGISSDVINVYVLIGEEKGYDKLTPYSDNDGKLVYYLDTYDLGASQRVGYALNINVESTNEYSVKGVFSARLWATNEQKTSMQIFGEPEGVDISNTLTTDESVVESPEISNRYIVKIVLKDENGNIISEQEIDRGTQLVKPVDPIKDNYIFDNWYNKDEIFDFNQEIFEDIELIAKFKRVWNVTFCYNNGLENNSIKVIDGDKIDKPEDPISNIEGKFFSNWFYTDKDVYDFNMPVVGDLVLNARYAGKIIITLDVGDGIPVDDIEIVQGTALPELPCPNYIDGCFNHWEDENGNEVKAGDIVSTDRLIACYDYLGDYAYANMRSIGQNKAGYSLVRLREEPSNLSDYTDYGFYRQHNWCDLKKPTHGNEYYITEVMHYGITKNGWMGTKILPTDLFSAVYCLVDDSSKSIYIYSRAKYIVFADFVYGFGMRENTNISSYERVKSGQKLLYTDRPNSELIYSPGTVATTKSDCSNLYLFNNRSSIDIFNCIIGTECQDFSSFQGEILDLSKCILADCTGTDMIFPRFSNSPNLKEIIMPTLRHNKLLSLSYMFSGCSSIEYIDLTMFDITPGKDLKDVNKYNFQEVSRGSYLNRTFSGCTALEEVMYPDDFIDIDVTWGCASFTYYNCKIDKFDFNREDFEWMLDNDSGYEYLISVNDKKSPCVATSVTRLKYSSIKDSTYQHIPGTFRSLRLTGIPYYSTKDFTSHLDGVSNDDIYYPVYRTNSLKFAFGRVNNVQYVTNHTDLCYDIIGAIDKEGNFFDVNYFMTLSCVLEAVIEAKEGCIKPGPELSDIWSSDAVYLRMSEVKPDVDVIDISLRQDGSIVTWYDSGSKTQYIYSDVDKIYFNSNGYNLFSSLVNVEYMDLSRFSSEYCVIYNKMFYNCVNLKKIDYSDDFTYKGDNEGDYYEFTWPLSTEYDLLPAHWKDIGYVAASGASAYLHRWGRRGCIECRFVDSENGYSKSYTIGNFRSLSTIIDELPECIPIDDTYRFIGWSSSNKPSAGTLINLDTVVYNYSQSSRVFYALVERVGISMAGNLIGQKIRENFNTDDIMYFRNSNKRPDSDYVDISLSENESLLLYMDGNTLCWYSDNNKFIVTDNAISMFSGLSNIVEIDLTGIDFMSVYVVAWMFSNCTNLTNIIYGDKFVNGDKYAGRYSYDYYNTQYGTGNYAAYMFYNCPANKPDTYSIGRFSPEGTYYADKYITLSIYYGLPNTNKETVKVRYGYTLSEIDDEKLKIKPPSEDIEFLGWYSGTDVIDEDYPIVKDMTIVAKWSRPGFLETGSSFNSKINNNARYIRVIDSEPVGISVVDCSQFKDGSIVTWYSSSDYTQYIYSYNGVVMMSEDCSSMFKGKSKLVSIDLNYMDFSYVQNMSYMFYGLTVLSDLDCSLIYADNLSDLSYMFYNCYNLSELDFTGFNTGNVLNYRYMFYNCSKLNNVVYGDYFNLSSNCIVSSINSGNPTYYMFYNCLANKPEWEPGRFGGDGTYVDGLNVVINFNINKPTAMTSDVNTPQAISLKYGYSAKECNIDLPVLDSKDGFKFIGWYVHQSKSVLLTDKLDMDTPVSVSKVVYARWEKTGYANTGTIVNKPIYSSKGISFKQSLVPPSQDISSGSITDVSLMGDGSVVIWKDTSNNEVLWYSKSGKMIMPENASNLFASANTLQEISLNNIDLSGSKNLSYLFYNCSRLVNIDFSNISTSNVQYMNYMFSGCSAITKIDMSKFDLSNVLDVSYLFNGCSSITNINMNGIRLQKVTNMNYMFNSCGKLTSIDIKSVTAPECLYCSYMFSNCSALMSIDISNLDTRKVTNFGYMFYRSGSLTSITYGSNFKPESGTNFSYMYRYSNNAPKPSSWTGTWNGYGSYMK